MPKKLGPIRSVERTEGIRVFDDGSLRCIVIELKGGDLCLYNPIKGLSAELAQALHEIGPVKYLLSPNHYHNRAFAEHSDRFAAASACASTDARPRLQKVTGLQFASLTGLKRKLPPHICLLDTKGLKTGEVWLRIKKGKDVCWLVGDAFCGPKIKKPPSFSATPELLKPFPAYGVGDRARYVDWVTTQIQKDMPSTVIPCHGGMIRSKQLPKKLLGLVSKLG